MSIYLESKSGKFRVEVEGKLGRYRDRCDSRKTAKQRELEFKEMRAKSLPPTTVTRERQRLPVSSHSFSEARKAAQGRVWRGMASEPGNLAILKIVEELKGDTPLDAIDDAWVLGLRDALVDERGIQNHTVNRYMAALSGFLKWCRKMKLMTVAIPEFPWVRETSHRIRWITPAEEAKMYALLPRRIKRFVWIAIETGMRRSEILSLEPKQIQDGWVHIWKTKSNSPRSLPLTRLQAATLLWMAHGNMPTIMDLRRAWTSMRKSMKLDKDPEFVLHACRHTRATRMVQKNVNLRLIQRWMGHRDIKMTLRYAQVNDEMLSGVLEQIAA